MAATKTKAKKPTKKPSKAKTKKPTKKPSKAKTKKPSKAKAAKKTQPTTGQSAEEFDLTYEELNKLELRVVKMLNGKGKGTREIHTISQLMDAMPTKTLKAKKNSWVRNSLRRLVPGGFVEKVERGTYRITQKGRNRVNAAA